MAALKLQLESVLRELRGMSRLADKFLEARGDTLEAASYRLKDICRHRSGEWKVLTPIRTKTTRSYEPKGMGGPPVAGMLSFQWDVKCHDKRHILLGERTSTKLTIVRADEQGDGPEIICWKIEAGDKHAPGCHFHVQVPTSVNGMSFPVPRLPSILLTPGDCLDFLLGELFQEEWAKHQQDYSWGNPGWRGETRNRLANLLNTQAERVASSANVTPWMHLKQWKLDNPRFEC